MYSGKKICTKDGEKNMSVIIQQAQAGQLMMNKASPAMKRSLEKLSSGLRTDKSGKLFTSGTSDGEIMRSRSGGIMKALTTTQDGISMIQAASDALDRTQEMLGQMRGLAVQASGDNLTQQDRGYIQAELNGIRSEITELAENTRFGRKSLLNGDNAVLWSSTDKGIKAVVNGGLRSPGRFGGNYAVDGNFELSITTQPGQPELQVSESFRDYDSGTLLRDSGMPGNPAELTLTQGDGRQAVVVLYPDDTLDDMAAKMNRAVASGLGQGEFAGNDAGFVAFNEAGELVMRSSVAGKMGTITLSGSDEVLDALSMKTVQEAQENTYSVTVKDIDSGMITAEDVKISGGRLKGVIHENIDVEFSPSLGIRATLDDGMGGFRLEDETGGAGLKATLHVADNSSVFQAGAGAGGDVLLSIGDMRAGALGLGGLNVMSRASALEAVATVDEAADKVAMQQARLGTSQKRLERYAENLSGEAEPLFLTEGRAIRNDDAEEILKSAKEGISSQPNAAILSQANQARQNVLVLFRG